MNMFLKQSCLVLAVVFLLGVVQSVAATDEQTVTGGELYTSLCAACHTEKPGNMMGQPVEDLAAKMKTVKNLPSASGKLAQMQAALKPLSDQQMQDIAVYLNGLK